MFQWNGSFWMQTVADVVIGSIVPQELTHGDRHVQGLRAGTQRRQGWSVAELTKHLCPLYFLSLDHESTQLPCLGLQAVGQGLGLWKQ